MSRSALLICMLLASAVFAGHASAAQDPTMHQVYQAAQAGRLDEAQRMMDQVLRDHPNSGKAHYVEAELMAKQGRLASAAAELGTAERLAPGLPFAKPQSVQDLQRHIASAHAGTRPAPGARSSQFGAAYGIPWGLLLLGIALIAAFVYFARSMSRRNAGMMAPAGGPAYGTGFGPGAPGQPYGPGGVAPPMGTAAGGIGSGILGGLASGAALGAGMVAGEALMHRFTNGNQLPGNQNLFPASTDFPASADWDSVPDDMGGSDFGISDASSSWDDSSGGGGDWN
ncbi:MAG: tetratricopeptide repeat protein [Burkholderiales bacterium]|jgi:hypothetical protein